MSDRVTTGPFTTGAIMGGAALHDCVLTPLEMAALNARLAVRTGGRVAVGPDPITRRQARAIWHAAQSFAAAQTHRPESCSPPGRSAKFRQPDTRLSSSGRGLAALVLSAATMSGCATFGGNVKGGFACRAPDGICAPTSKIDDQALAMISGGDGDRMPAGMVDPGTNDDPRFTPISASAHLTRTSEKVLRIVFPAHVDRQGRYREASAIHAVVERSAWADTGYSTSAQASGSSNGAGPRLASVDQGPSLAEMAAASPEVSFPISPPDALAVPVTGAVAAVTDPAAPSAAAVMAARQKGHSAKARAPMVRTSLFMRHHKHAAPHTAPASALAGSATKASLAQLASKTSAPPGVSPSVALTPHVNAAPFAIAPVTKAAAKVSPAAASAQPVSSFDLRNVGTASPLQSIRDQVGTIFAAHAMTRPAASASAAASPAEHPVNGPAVLAVSGVDK